MSLSDKGRKRRCSEDEEMMDATNSSSFLTTRRSSMSNKQQQQAMGWKKRSKTGITKKTSLDLKLATMDKDKLLQVLASLLESQPDLKHDMIRYIPAPTIPSTIGVLNDKEKKVWASFPYNKRGPQRDHYTFSRVRESLLDLIDTITHYSHHFVSSTSVFPTTCFTYLDQVTYFAHRLPTWDIDDHNQHVRDLYQELAHFWTVAIQRTFDTLTHGSTFHSDTIGLWAKSLAHHNTLAGGAFDHAIHHFNQCFLLPPRKTCHPAAASAPPAATSAPAGSPMVGFADFR